MSHDEAVHHLLAMARRDPAGALERAAALCDDTRPGTATSELRWWAGAARADAMQRLGDLSEVVLEVRALQAQGPPAPVAPYLSWVLSRVFGQVGDDATSLEHAVDAARGPQDGVPVDLRVRVQTQLADALDRLGAVEEARRAYARAEAAAEGDPELHVLVVNNRAYGCFEAGEVQLAAEQALRLVDVAAGYGVPLSCTELDTLARVALATGELERALRLAERAVAEIDGIPARSSSALPEYQLTLAVALRSAGLLERAGAVLDDAQRSAGDPGRSWVAVQVLQERAELFAALGDHARAFSTHQAFFAAHVAQVSERRELQARVRQAVFETSSALAEAERFRERALRDPLTTLHNRAHVDEELPRLLGRASAGAGQRACVLALFDVDHFKSVNDVHSHLAGDAVLQRLASMLQGAAAEVGGESFAARLGGEEFLLVLDCEQDVARDAVERLRSRVAGAEWADLTPGRGITVSAGLAASWRGATQRELLGAADRLLYEAKQTGRNRVCAAA